MTDFCYCTIMAGHKYICEVCFEKYRRTRAVTYKGQKKGKATVGYYASMEYSRFHIKKSKIPKVAKALREWSNTHPSWVNPITSKNIQDIFRLCRWNVELDDKGDIVEIEFCGEKLGDDERMFSAIASYVTDKSYIQMIGEEGHKWRWYFIKGALKEDNMKPIWDSDEELRCE